MSRKIVGLDIGSHSIKVVSARERLGKVELLQFYERPVNGEGIEELLKSIFQEGGLHPDVVVSSVPGSAVSVHYLKIPFSDEAKIGQVVPYEVEGIIPFPLEEMVIDQFILSKSNGTGPNNGSAVCVALIRKETLKNHIDTLKGAYIEPKIIEIESLALYHAFREWYKTEDTVALLDIGADRSNLCIVSKGKPVYLRTFNRGGRRITSAIQEALGTSFDDAESKKKSIGIILDESSAPPGGNGEGGRDETLRDRPSGLSTEQGAEGKEKFGAGGRESETEEVSSAIKRGLIPLIVDLKQSLHAYEIQQDDIVKRLYIAGGGARLKNIDRLLNGELEMEVEPLGIPGELVQRFTGGETADPALVPAAGLVLRGARKKQVSGLNFRKGEYFHRKEVKEATGKLLYLIVAVAGIVSLGALDFYFRYHDREARYEVIKSGVRKAYLETFPDAKIIVDESRQLRSAVDELRKKVAALGGGPEKRVTSLDLLNAITEKIPGEIQVNVDDLLIDRTKVRIQGDTDSFENVERIKRELETIPFLKKVDVGDAKLSADQKRVKFRIIIDME